jgi:hypothetical protein
MSTFKIVGAAAALSILGTMPALAQEVISDPGYCAFFYPNANCQNKGPGNPTPIPTIIISATPSMDGGTDLPSDPPWQHRPGDRGCIDHIRLRCARNNICCDGELSIGILTGILMKSDRTHRRAASKPDDSLPINPDC